MLHVCDHGKSAERFQPAIGFVSLESLLQVGDAQHELRVCCDEYVRDNLQCVPRKMVDEDLGTVYHGDLDDSDWTVEDLDSTPRSASAGHVREICESFRRIQQTRCKLGKEVPQNLLELLSSLAKEPIAVRSHATTPNLKCLEAQHNAFCEETGRSWERLLDFESELVVELNNF